MGYISEEISRAIKENHLKAYLLSSVYIENLRITIIEKYCDRNTELMWEGFKDCAYYQNINAWSLIHDYVKDNE